MTALERVADIIANGMGLASDQVWLYDQRVRIPNDSRLYVVVGVQSLKPFGNTRRSPTVSEPDVASRVTDGSAEELSLNVQATLSIDVFSHGPAARDQKEQILLALHSTYSQQQQEAFGFHVAPLTSGFVDLSSIEEGPAINYRFNLSLNIQYLITKTDAVQYYDNNFGVGVPLVNP